jgi:PAS domain S-box-containing protein
MSPGGQIPDHEQERLQRLWDCRVLDTQPEPIFDDLVRLATHVMGTPAAMLGLADADRVWFKAKIGCDWTQVPRTASPCALVVAMGRSLHTTEVDGQPRFCETGESCCPPGVRFYAGAPLIAAGGLVLGTLCVFDTQPRQVSDTQLQMLEALARQATKLLEQRIDAQRLRLFESVVVNSSDGVLVTEPTPRDELGRRIIYANEAAARMGGYQTQELIGKSFSIFHGKQTDAHALEQIHWALDHWQPIRIELVNHRRDGSTFWAEMQMVPVPDGLGGYSHWASLWRDNTQRHAIEERLRLLESVAVNAQEGVIIAQADHATPEGPAIVYVNAALERMTGYSLAELVGRGPGMLGGPRTDPVAIEQMRRAAARGEPTRVELIHYRRDGAERCVEIDMAPAHDEAGNLLHWVFMHRDITQRRQAEERLQSFMSELLRAKKQLERKSDELREKNTELEIVRAATAAANIELTKLSLVVSRTDNAVVITDAQGRIEWVNEAFTRQSGYGSDEVRGRTPSEVLHGPQTDPKTIAHIRQCLAAAQPFQVEAMHYRKNGQPYWVSVQVQPIFDDEGQLQHFIGLEIDITDRRKMEQAQREAREAAETANRSKSEFLANISHEMRTPLGAIIGFSDLMLRQVAQNPVEMLEWARTINSSGKNLLVLINDLLDLTKIEAGRMPFERAATPLRTLIDEVLTTFKPKAQEKGLDLRVEHPAAIPTEVYTDAMRLRQVLVNLVGNAVKFTEAGQVVLRPRLEARGGKLLLVVEVSDTGIGMPPERVAHLFQPFMQADNSITRKYGGTGLGLAISRRICRALGGDLIHVAQNAPGSCFRMTIEVTPDPATATAAAADQTAKLQTGSAVDAASSSAASSSPMSSSASASAAAAASAPPAWAPAASAPSGAAPLKARVLVVDDGMSNRRLISLILTRAGAQVSTAEHGEEALRLIDQHDYDVILMDMQMPVMDGYTATAMLRKRGWTKPIIALTAHAMTGDRQKCLDAGCSDYLSKPIEMDALIQVVRAAVPANPNAAAERDQTMVSTLPLDDADFREVVVQFIEQLQRQTQALQQAVERCAYAEVAQLAHWLKGSAGTAGFTGFTIPAVALEAAARAADLERVRSALAEVLNLACRAQRGFAAAKAADGPTPPVVERKSV